MRPVKKIPGLPPQTRDFFRLFGFSSGLLRQNDDVARLEVVEVQAGVELRNQRHVLAVADAGVVTHLDDGVAVLDLDAGNGVLRAGGAGGEHQDLVAFLEAIEAGEIVHAQQNIGIVGGVIKAGGLDESIGRVVLRDGDLLEVVQNAFLGLEGLGGLGVLGRSKAWAR